jgi:hypothetical protein
VTEDVALVAHKMTVLRTVADEEEGGDPFADVDDAFPQEGWQRQKEDKEDGLIKQVCHSSYQPARDVIEFHAGARDFRRFGRRQA